MGGGKCSRKLKMLMSNRRKLTQNCWIFLARRSDESRHLLLPFPVLRLLRSYRSLRSLQTLRTIRSIRVLNSIRTIRVLNPVREIRVQNKM